MTDQPASPPRTAVVMLNLGGPATLDEVEPFLLRLFSDREIIQLPFQNLLGPWIARRRAPKVRRRYAQIGGGSPILYWTRAQGVGMVRLLDRLSPHTAPHRFYPVFRYSPPFAADALLQMQADGIQRALAFTQYPQFSCATTGSNLHDLWQTARRLGLERSFQWSVIDRWPAHPGFVEALCQTIHAGLLKFPPSEREKVLLLFSAHSLPMRVVKRGDPYPREIGATVQAVIQRLGLKNEYLLSYQSAVGPVRWLGPSTEAMVRRLGEQGRKNVLVVPIAFTSDHIETLHEIDLELKDMALHSGIGRFERASALNDAPIFLTALADIVASHLASGELCSPQYGLPCPGCTRPDCREILNPIRPLEHA